jgi:hypothetical protein
VAIVTLFNEAIATVMHEVDKVGRGAEVRHHLASFATGAGIYDALFQRAGPRIDGTFDVPKIVENANVLVGLEQAEAMLAQWLYEYISFALFIAEPVLREAAARSGQAAPNLSKPVLDLVAPLSPSRH